MKKRLVSLFAAAAVAVGAMVSTLAYTDTQNFEADALNSLGLFLGTDKGYELDKSLTRAEGVTFIVRMYGKADEAKANADKYDISFTDLVGWERGYVGYAFENNITKGRSDTIFDPTGELTDYMFLTFTLRALGYKDLGDGAQFVWDNPYELAESIGLIATKEANNGFNRGDAVSIFWNALEAELVGKDMTLAESLIAEGVFTADEYAKAIDISDDGKVEETTTIVVPEDTTTEPEPEDTTTEPEDTTTEPEDTTTEPEDTTTEPEDTTTEPEVGTGDNLPEDMTPWN